MSSKSVWTSHMTSKMIFWHTFWHIFIKIPAAAPHCQPPHHLLNFAAITTTREGEKSRWAAVRSLVRASQHSSQFPVLGSTECWVGRLSVGHALLFFLSVLMLPHHLGRFLKNAVLSYTPAKYRERWVYLFLQKHLPNLLELLTWPQKMTYWRTFWRIFIKSVHGTTQSTPWPPPCLLSFIAITDHWRAGEVWLGLWSTVWRGTSQN